MTNTDARAAASLFDPDRLRVARQLMRYKRVDLAKVAGVSAAAISQYERGDAKPRPATLAELALHLNMPVGFFAASGRPLPSLDSGQGFFRSLRSSRQLDRDAAISQAAILADLVSVIEQYVVLPKLDLPEDLTVSPTADLEEVERVADELRARWKMGGEPIKNVVRLLERHGVIVARLSLADTVDAFSWPEPQRPLIILGTEKDRRDRSRFDAGHELGHLVMHYSDPEPGNHKLERQAQRFAGAFLIPAEAMHTEFEGRRIDWSWLIDVKRRWQVSMQALLYRARDLQLISASGYESAMKQMSRRGWRRQEPGDLGPPESTALLRRAAELIGDAGVELEELADAVELPVERVEGLLGVREVDRPVVAI